MRLFTLAFFSYLLFFPSVATAQEATTSSDLFEPTPKPEITYPLPYPGILPDHILYPIKMIRDRIILFLITDPYKKVQFTLLQADKRLQAGVFLLHKNVKKEKLAFSTIAKGENYFHQALQEVERMKREGRDVKTLLENLDHASLKHAQVLTDLRIDFPSYRVDLERLLTQVTSLQRQIDLLKKQ